MSKNLTQQQIYEQNCIEFVTGKLPVPGPMNIKFLRMSFEQLYIKDVNHVLAHYKELLKNPKVVGAWDAEVMKRMCEDTYYNLMTYLDTVESSPPITTELKKTYARTLNFHGQMGVCMDMFNNPGNLGHWMLCNTPKCAVVDELHKLLFPRYLYSGMMVTEPYMLTAITNMDHLIAERYAFFTIAYDNYKNMIPYLTQPILNQISMQGGLPTVAAFMSIVDMRSFSTVAALNAAGMRQETMTRRLAKLYLDLSDTYKKEKTVFTMNERVAELIKEISNVRSENSNHFNKLLMDIVDRNSIIYSMPL